MAKQVAIVGAGISGLLACKYTLSKGFDPVVFESRDSIGGVWTKTIQSTKLQTPKSLYQFSDFPWPPQVTEDFPTQNQVLDYLQAYAHHFNLFKNIRFNSKVVSLSYEGPSDAEMEAWAFWSETGEPFAPKGKWNVTVENTSSRTTETYQVDFVILCLGRYSDVPKFPNFPANKGPEAFPGKVIHSMEYSNMDHATAHKFIQGKQVTVVGFQKSGMDISMEISTANGIEHPCTLLYRTEHWNIPDYIPWGVPLGYLYQSRFSELLIHKPAEGLLLSLLATIFSPLRWGISKFVESHIKRKLRLAQHGLRKEASNLRKRKVLPFAVKDCVTGKTRLPLYRECIHPRIPQLALVGLSVSVADLFTSEIRCRWLVELLSGTFKLPSLKEMESNVSQWNDSMKQSLGEYYERSCLGALQIWYIDQLCKDMGWNPRRKKGLLRELFEPYGPLDYV
ncbi:unnamed protein product [Fraxinus pennsylvanica]|uniref:Flavin-containing monooxygenase n=1 Tax=Fraxinus pennsylvanica TaxID=56036 RepID=A0AAD1ZI96_9LAMI|nr:unnamed protein product [Fraxinus pennsylvanica]